MNKIRHCPTFLKNGSNEIHATFMKPIFIAENLNRYYWGTQPSFEDDRVLLTQCKNIFENGYIRYIEN